MRTPAMIAALLSIAACSESVDPHPGAPLFAENCAICHGRDGKGSGPLASATPTAPSDLTKLSGNNGGTFPMLYVMSTIDGFRHQGMDTRPGMPEFGPLLNSPVVLFDSGDGIATPTPEPLVDIALYLESIQQGVAASQ